MSESQTTEHNQDSQRPVRTIATIMVSVLLMGTGSALQGTALTLRAGIEGFSETTIGLIMSIYFVGLAAGTFLSTTVIRSVGYVRSFAAFASIASAAAFAHVLVIHPVAWIIFRAVHGLCLSVMLVVVESWLNVSSSTYNRGRVLSIYSVVYLASMGIGQPLLGRFSPATYEVFGITTILVSLSLVPMALTRVTGSPRVAQRRPRILSTFFRSRLAGTGVVISGLIFGASWSLIPRYGQRAGLGEGGIGVLMLLLSVGTLAMQWPLGWLSDRRDRRKAIFYASAVGLAAAVAIALFRPGGIFLYILVLIFGGFSMPLYSLSIALMNDQLNRDEMVEAAGALIILYGVGSTLGPLLGGPAMGRFGSQGLFYLMAGALGVLLLFVLLRLTRVPELPERIRRRYRPFPRTTYAAFSMLKKVARRRKREGE